MLKTLSQEHECEAKLEGCQGTGRGTNISCLGDGGYFWDDVGKWKYFCNPCYRNSEHRCPKCRQPREALKFYYNQPIISKAMICKTCRKADQALKEHFYETEIKPNIMQIWKEFKQKNTRFQNYQILDDTDFQEVKAFLKKNDMPKIWVATLLGHLGPVSHGIMLTTEQANSILDMMDELEYSDKNPRWLFYHAIVHHILLLKDIEDRSRIIKQYYRDTVEREWIKKWWKDNTGYREVMRHD